MEDIALILKVIVVYPEGRLEATLLDGRTVSLSYTHTTREHKWALHPEDKRGGVPALLHSDCAGPQAEKKTLLLFAVPSCLMGTV